MKINKLQVLLFCDKGQIISVELDNKNNMIGVLIEECDDLSNKYLLVYENKMFLRGKQDLRSLMSESKQYVARLYRTTNEFELQELSEPIHESYLPKEGFFLPWI